MDIFAKTGVHGLDEILSGGIPRGNSVILEGPPGIGKTTLAIQFLVEGALKYNEPGIYFSFEEHPEQIYRDMMHYGFDLRKLEELDLLRVVSISSETYRASLEEGGGLIEQLINEIGCKRVVIDSISLFCLEEGEPIHRELINQVNNFLHRFELTSLLLLELGEQSTNSSFEHFVFDGVIRMRLKEHMECFRALTIEITKMRGVDVMHGEHIFRIGPTGVHVIPAYSTVSNEVNSPHKRITTGIPSLDNVLSGGLIDKSIYVLDADSRSNTLPLRMSIICERIKAHNSLLIIPSGTVSLREMVCMYKRWGVHFDQLVAQGRLYIIQQFEGEISEGLKNGVLDVHALNDMEYFALLEKKMGPIIRESKNQGTDWFIFYDFNALIGKRGEEWLTSVFTTVISFLRELGVTAFGFCNTNEVGEKMKNLIERTSDCILKVWSNSQYQFLQIQKSIDGKTSAPLIMERTDKSPFIRLF